MDSFYAGLPGTPFILKQRFTSTEAMKKAFNLQEEYTDVFYGEYCIIDTINKSHPENGQIYRRGYSEPEYIGRVVGPSGLFCDNIRIVTRDKNSETIGECYDDNIGKNVIVRDSSKSTWITRLKNNNNSENIDNSDEGSNSESDSSSSEEQVLSFDPYDFITALDSEYKQKYKIIVYDIYENVSDEKGGYTKETVATCFAGVYDVLESMQEYPNGKTVLKYSSSPDEILADEDGNSIIKSWLENVSFDSNTGQLKFTGNGCNETLNKVFFLKLLKNVKLDPDGTIHFLYTNEGAQGQPDNPVEVDESLNQALTWIKDVRLDKNKGQLQIYFNNDKISPIIAENLAIFDSHSTLPYYFKEILSEDDGFYVKMEDITKDSFSENSDYKTDPKVAADNISDTVVVSYPALTTNNPDENNPFYSYEPCYTNIPLEIEFEVSSTKKVYSADLLIKEITKDGAKEAVKAGDLSESDGSLSWSESDENVYYYDSAGVQVIKTTDGSNISEKFKAQILFNNFHLYEIDWPLTEDGSFIEIVKDGITYRKISFEKMADGETGSLTFGEDDGSFSYKFIGQERVNGQFNFVKEVVENDLGYTAVTNTKNETSLSKTQNFRTPKEFFFFDGNTPPKYSFHLFANYSYPELTLLSEKNDENPVEVGAYYISLDPIKIYLGAEGEEPYQEVESSSEIFCYQETCYQIGENGAVEEFSIEKGYPFIDETNNIDEAFWKDKVEKGYWKDLGKISDGLTNDLPSLLANIAYTVEPPGVTSKETQNQILWG